MSIAGEDPLGSLYVAAQGLGISRVDGGRFVGFASFIHPSFMITYRQNMWFGGDGIFRVPADSFRRWEREPDEPMDYTPFSRADGLMSSESSSGWPKLTITPDGKFWVSTVQGLAMLDLPRLTRAAGKPAIYVGEIEVDRKTRPSGSELVLSPRMHHVEVHFDSIELSSPERSRLQYRLDGVDTAWFDAGAIHSAVYTNIPPGTHQFHVRASNRDGIWDRAGIVYNIVQQPYFYETAIFRLATVTAGLLLLAGLYRLRLRQAAARLNAHLEGKLAERERIARELHDTLLQGIQGLVLLFEAGTRRIPEQEPSRKFFEETLVRAAKVIAEGRDRVQNLRTSSAGLGELSKAFLRVGEEMAQGSEVALRVILEGDSRELQPEVSDEAYWIGREALVNSFSHSGARRIEVEIDYGLGELRLRFRDDGRGIDPRILESGGRPRHWGIPGMRERAEKIGGTLEVSSQPNAGTEIQLSIPAQSAYRKRSAYSPWRWFRRGRDRGEVGI